jgi:hypothetical protein
MGGKAVPQGMHAYLFADIGFRQCFVDDILYERSPIGWPGVLPSKSQVCGLTVDRYRGNFSASNFDRGA